MADADANTATPHSGGLMSALAGISKIADPQLIQNLGLGLMSAAKYGGNIGDGLMGAIQNYQQQKSNSLQQTAAKQQIAMNALAMQRQQGLMNLLPGLLGQGGAPGSQGGNAPVPSQAAPEAQTMQGTQSVAGSSLGGSQAAGAAPELPSWLTPPSASDIAGTPVNGVDPRLLPAYNVLSGKLPTEGTEQVRQAQLEIAKRTYAPAIAQLQGIVQSDNPSRDVLASPVLKSTWAHYAAARGLDPGFDPRKDFTDANVRQVMGQVANSYASQLGMPTSAPPIPLKTQNIPYGEIAQIDPVTGKKEADLMPARPPEFTMVDQWDPATQKMRKVPIQTGGFGMQGANQQGGITRIGGLPGSASQGAPQTWPAPSGVPAGQGAPGYDAGFKPPTDQELKSAMFGSEMRAGMETLTRMEAQGYNLPPRIRAAFINAATSEDSGMIAQLLSQEALVHGMRPQDQTYMAALMPMLQAAGHDQSGARLTTGQIRQNLESLVPISSSNRDALTQVQKNRQGFYQGLLTQAGPAVQMPQYRDTLLADLQSSQGTRKVISGKTYVKQGGKWYATQ